jgi:ABC-type transporter Mla maintaining outer membrane lipid asymmetry ATPase subunit MlaF
LYEGKVVFEGSPQEMLQQNNEYTKQFVTASLEGPMQMITEK